MPHPLLTAKQPLPRRVRTAKGHRPALYAPAEVWIAGIDLAWGEKNRDGVCLIHATARGAQVVSLGHPYGDEELTQWMRTHIPRSAPSLALIDAPIVCPNPTGTRPVDRLTHRLFHRQHAACHPANSTKCPRPPRVAKRLGRLGFKIGWEWNAKTPRLVTEVYPHPAMVRLFDLPRIIKYKKGSVRDRRKEFRRYQHLLQLLLTERFSNLDPGPEVRKLLRARWTKPVEDQLDGFFCALIGYHHWLHRGSKSGAIGDLKTGFILLPAEKSGLITAEGEEIRG